MKIQTGTKSHDLTVTKYTNTYITKYSVKYQIRMLYLNGTKTNQKKTVTFYENNRKRQREWTGY